MGELTLVHDLPLGHLTVTHPDQFHSVDLTGINPATGYRYGIGLFAHEVPNFPRIVVSTENRSEFLTKGTEEEAQIALVGLSQGIRQLSGGIFNIHPFYGAVSGTRLTPIVPGFGDLPRMDASLSMSVVMSNNGYRFDKASEQAAVDIGTTIEVPGPNDQLFIRYMQTPLSNPNQRNRDQAVVNNLGQRWDEEFQSFNGPKRHFGRRMVPSAMEITPNTVLGLMRVLGSEALLSKVRINTLRLQGTFID